MKMQTNLYFHILEKKCMEVTDGVSKFNYATLLQHLVI
jgi:hypothetical protein